MDSITIKNYLKSHPGISVTYVERLLKIPVGTIRVTTDKPIPSKYIKSIEFVLREYGFQN